MTEKETGTRPSAETQTAEEAEARAAHRADRMPTTEESQAAPEGASPETGKSYEEMAERGANDKGEGRLP